MAPIRTKDSQETDSAGRDGTTQQNNRYSPLGASPLGRDRHGGHSSIGSRQPPGSPSGSITEVGSCRGDCNAKQLFESTKLPFPATRHIDPSDPDLPNIPEFAINGSLVPCKPSPTGHRIWGIDPTPYFEPSYELLEKTDLAGRISYVREMRALGTERKGDGPGEPSEMQLFFESYHRFVAIFAADIPNIQGLPPVEQVKAMSNVHLLYRTEHYLTMGSRKEYPVYPSWKELTKQQEDAQKSPWRLFPESMLGKWSLPGASGDDSDTKPFVSPSTPSRNLSPGVPYRGPSLLRP